jgi:hypothetical protein
MFGYDRLTGRGALVALIAAAAMVTLSSQAMAVPTLSFDDDADEQTGTVAHTAGGPAIGTDIDYFSVVGNDTPLNDGAVLDCIGCVLNFTTGTVVTEGPPSWQWAGGGTFTLTGALEDSMAAPVASGTLVSGTFDVAFASGNGNSLTFSGFGTDTKNVDLLAYYGISPEFASNFEFANTQLALNNATIDSDGSFTANVQNADLDNTIPVPGTLGLLGLGMVALGAAMRRKQTA